MLSLGNQREMFDTSSPAQRERDHRGSCMYYNGLIGTRRKELLPSTWVYTTSFRTGWEILRQDLSLCCWACNTRKQHSHSRNLGYVSISLDKTRKSFLFFFSSFCVIRPYEFWWRSVQIGDAGYTTADQTDIDFVSHLRPPLIHLRRRNPFLKRRPLFCLFAASFIHSSSSNLCV